MGRKTVITKELSIYERQMLALRVLPSEGGSFREAIRVRQIRNLLALSDEEKEAVEYKETQQGPQWNPTKAKEVGEAEIDLEEGDLEVIALGFKKMETEGSIPTNDDFIDLYLKFEEEVSEVEV